MPEPQPSKQAVCVGINDYTGTANDLSGCVNDASDWSELLRSQYGFETELLLDDQASRAGVLAALERLVDSAGDDGAAVFTYSGLYRHEKRIVRPVRLAGHTGRTVKRWRASQLVNIALSLTVSTHDRRNRRPRQYKCATEARAPTDRCRSEEEGNGRSGACGRCHARTIRVPPWIFKAVCTR